jgi:hypothetical protein
MKPPEIRITLLYRPLLIQGNKHSNCVAEETYNYGSNTPSRTKLNLIHKLGSMVCYCSKRLEKQSFNSHPEYK